MLEIQANDKELPSSALKKVKALSATSTSRFKLGAVVVKGKRVIGAGINSKKTSPRFGSGSYACVHAEGAAIWSCIKRGNDPKGCVIIVHRVNDNCSRSCKDCQDLMIKFGIKKAYYYNESQELVCTWP